MELGFQMTCNKLQAARFGVLRRFCDGTTGYLIDKIPVGLTFSCTCFYSTQGRVPLLGAARAVLGRRTLRF